MSSYETERDAPSTVQDFRVENQCPPYEACVHREWFESCEDCVELRNALHQHKTFLGGNYDDME